MRVLAIVAALAAVSLAWAADSYWPHGAKVYIISPKDGATVKNPFTVRFGAKGVKIGPAGVKAENTGHHHLLIDAELPPDLDLPLPVTDHIKHFGKGQTETTLSLPAGTHTLQLVLGDENHIPHSPPLVSRKITVHVSG